MRFIHGKQRLGGFPVCSRLAQGLRSLDQYLEAIIFKATENPVYTFLLSGEKWAKMSGGAAGLSAHFKIRVIHGRKQMLLHIRVEIVHNLDGLDDVSAYEADLLEIASEKSSHKAGRGPVGEHFKQSRNFFPVPGKADQFNTQIAVLPGPMAEQARRPVTIVCQIVLVAHLGSGVEVMPGAAVGFGKHPQEPGVSDQVSEGGVLVAVAVREALIAIDFADYPLDRFAPEKIPALLGHLLQPVRVFDQG